MTVHWPRSALVPSNEGAYTHLPWMEPMSLRDARRVSNEGQPSKADKRLHPPYQRLLSRRQSADYWGVGEKQFDELVKNGVAPQPVPVISPRRWDVRDHDRAIDILGGRPKNEEEMALAALDRLRPPLVY